jgi:hypothetical protein
MQVAAIPPPQLAVSSADHLPPLCSEQGCMAGCHSTDLCLLNNSLAMLTADSHTAAPMWLHHPHHHHPLLRHQLLLLLQLFLYLLLLFLLLSSQQLRLASQLAASIARGPVRFPLGGQLRLSLLGRHQLEGRLRTYYFSSLWGPWRREIIGWAASET